MQDDEMDRKIEAFAKKLKYEEILVFMPGEVEYERSVATANLLYRYARPHCVVQPKRSSQVQTIVNEVSKHKLQITIKNGGHSYAGFSTAEVGVSLDLSKMNTATLNDAKDEITLQGGCLWGHAYKQLVNLHMNGYVINGGRCPTVGVSGFLLGGGLGPFTRTKGMGCDSLKEATIVTADGKEVVVKRNGETDPDKKDLFWALCGGGGANFGVLVEVKMPVEKLSGDKVVAGRFTWTPTGTGKYNFLSIMNSFYTIKWPRKTTIDSSWLQTPGTDRQVRFLTYHDGSKDEFDATMDSKITNEELKTQLKRRSLPEDSTRFLHETLVAQWSEEIVKTFPTNRKFTLYTSWVFSNEKATIEAVTPVMDEQMKAFSARFFGEVCLLQVSWIHGGGKPRDQGSDTTAFPWRDGVYYAYILLEWEEKYLERDMRDFFEKMRDAIRGFSLEGKAAFINFADPTFIDEETYKNAYFGDNYEKLQRVKYRWDKENLFNWSQGVRPTGAPPLAPRRNGNELDWYSHWQFSVFRSERINPGYFPGVGTIEGGIWGVRPIGLSDLSF